jgi:hypothetical protein
MVMDGWTATTPYANKRHNTVVYLLKARTVEPEKQPLLGNARM